MKELNTFRQYLTEGVIKENEEQGYTLYDTKVEYDNGKTGYMFQLVNSEDGEVKMKLVSINYILMMKITV